MNRYTIEARHPGDWEPIGTRPNGPWRSLVGCAPLCGRCCLQVLSKGTSKGCGTIDTRARNGVQGNPQGGGVQKPKRYRKPKKYRESCIDRQLENYCRNLDIFLLKDESLEDTGNLPNPHIIAQEDRQRHRILRAGIPPCLTLLVSLPSIGPVDRLNGRRKIWLAEVIRGELVRLENGRNREEIARLLIEEAMKDRRFVVGLDFAFSFPMWFCEKLGAKEGIRSLGARG